MFGKPTKWMIGLRQIVTCLLLSILIVAQSFFLPTFTREASAQAVQPVTVTITKVRCVDDCDEAGLEALFASKPDFYARVTINGVTVDTPRAADDQDDIEPFWTVSTNVPTNSFPFIPVSIQIWDYDSTSGDDLADISPIPGDNNLDISVNLDTGLWSGDSANSCSKGDGNDEPVVEICWDISVQSSSGDADSDGLLDGWERNGLDFDGNGSIDVNLPAMGANPLHKDLFLELDSEVGQAPTRNGIQAMKRAFAAAPLPNPDNITGVNLWVDTGNVVDTTASEAASTPSCGDGIDNNGNGFVDGADPLCSGGNGANRRYLDTNSEVVAVANCGDGIDNDGDGQIDGADSSCLIGDNLGGGSTIPIVGACLLDNAFYTAKQANFSQFRRWVFRYAISSARPGAPTCTGASGGNGEIGGNDFVEFNHDGGTVMHELGHTLNLRHGGNEDTNCKPNHVSSMNYDNQFGINRVGGGAIIDYSPPRTVLNGSGRGAAPLNPLVENTLNENNILDTSDGNNRFIFSIGPGNPVQTNLNANPNWNNDVDPPLETSVTANIDDGTLPGCANTTTNETLNGFNDWQAVSLPFRQFGDSSDSAINAETENEPTLEQLIDHDEALHRTDLTVTVSDTPDPVAAGTRLTYIVIAANKGPNPASSVQIVNTLPAEVALVAFPTGCSAAGQVVTCNLGELVAGATVGVKITADVPEDIVYNNGSPLKISNRAEVRNLTGQELAPVDNVVNESTQVIAVADLSMILFRLPNPPIEMRLEESVVVRLSSAISSTGPSSPMDTALVLSAQASSGATITPTQLTTSQPHLTTGEFRQVDDYVIIRCDRPKTHTFKLQHRIRPLLVADTDPNPINDQQETAFKVKCTGETKPEDSSTR